MKRLISNFYLFLLLLIGFKSMAGEKDFTQVPQGLEVATFAGGCFWGMEDLFRNQNGVKETRVGYSGGNLDNPSYFSVTTGKTGHAESLQVLFDPKVISYESLVKYFFKIHDPTTLNQQGNDKGTQYRSVIFYGDNKQKETAQKVMDKLNKEKVWKKPIVTQLVPFVKFFAAEQYHQDYLVKNPGGYTCHYERNIDF